MLGVRQIVIVGFAAYARAPALSAQSSSPPAGANAATSDADFSIQDALIGQANAARAAGDYAAARAMMLEAVTSLLARPEDERSAEWLALLIEAGHAAYDAQDLRTARAAWQRVHDVRARTLPDDHPELQAARAKLGGVLSALGDLASARALEEKVLEVLVRTRPEDDRDLQYARQNLAATRYALGDFAGARELLEKALEVTSRTLSDDHPLLQSVRQNLAGALQAQGDVAGARALDEKVLAVRERTLPDDHPELQEARHNLAATMKVQGDLAGARLLEEKVLKVYSRTLPTNHPMLQKARHNLANTRLKMGDLAGARDLYELVLEVQTRTLPKDHRDLQVTRQNLSVALNRLGDLAGARALQEKVFEVQTRTLPADHPDLQRTRGNLANTLLALGDHAAARVLQEKVLEVNSRALPDDHPDLQTARSNLANLLANEGDLAGARALGEKVLEVYSRTLPDDHPDLQSARSSLANTRARLGDLAGARTLQETVLEVRTRTLTADDHALQTARTNLGVTLEDLGDLAAARALQEQALDVYQRTLPDDHHDLQLVRMHLARTIAREIARQRHRPEERSAPPATGASARGCADLVATVCRAQVHAARAAILESSGREVEERCASLANLVHASLSYALGYGACDPLVELEEPTFAFAETIRGAAIASADLVRGAAAAPEYRALREALREASDALAQLTRDGTTSEAFDRARVKRESVERELVALTRKLASGGASVEDLDIGSLCAKLSASEVAVSFRSFTRWGVEVVDELDSTGQPAVRLTSVASLCAFVVRNAENSAERYAASGAENAAEGSAKSARTSRVALVDLGPIASIAEAARAWREGIGVASDGRGVPASANSRATDGSSSAVRAHGTALREKVLDPLLPLLVGAEHVVVVLDDVLHLVPIDALPLDEKLLVGDRWQIETRTALTELMTSTDPFASQGELVAFGDVEYDAPTPVAPDTKRPDTVAQAAPVGDERRTIERASVLRGGPWAQGFTSLSGTGVEVRGIARAFADQLGNDAASSLCEGANATRERLLELAPKARWLHIATHGWFAPESIPSWNDSEPLDKQTGLGSRMSGEEQVKGMSPMLLCGLAFAGANSPENATGRAPGLITADELSTLDLSNCELAVLSACDTNVGERRTGQGVASLQLALQMAGARSVITSLWKVPDEATKELMLDFYRRLWVEKKPKHQALWEAKKKMREVKDERGEPKYTMRDWAAWVLTGEQD